LCSESCAGRWVRIAGARLEGVHRLVLDRSVRGNARKTMGWSLLNDKFKSTMLEKPSYLRTLMMEASETFISGSI
jgi:hypothetical protein